jgi:hypothetical protein
MHEQDEPSICGFTMKVAFTKRWITAFQLRSISHTKKRGYTEASAFLVS